ncbi:hypothetical protein BX659_1482 [Orenia metallireducens]|jgi:hypothetical protein|uniref:Uncharacterized protein n=1 Tax=Orenia metallireducens TaxID=1413210 RepID=A0A285H8F0_9FIRM|nr:protease complex subunit PrcB family protein [Orenia metallireducens]PRX17799.1 hypothetical protein BX659_1482 [Orenia metallireducens]SNY31126.1 hypothetical protein SAMN06265827_11488 [Orenia metallireducens]
MIKFPLKSLISNNENNKSLIPFQHLLPKKDEELCEKDDCSCQVDFQVITRRDHIFKLPKYHQKSLDLNIDYSKYFLIYASICGNNVRGCEVKIDKIKQKGNQIIVKAKRLIPSSSTFTLEMVNVPYDLVKVKKSKLLTKGLLHFKFIDCHDKLLYDTTFKVD